MTGSSPADQIRSVDSAPIASSRESTASSTQAGPDGFVIPNDAPEFDTVEDAIIALGDAQMRLGDLEGHDAKRRARECLNRCGFKPELQDRPVSELSGGWRMRCAVARAIYADPDLLMLDEIETFADLPTLLWLQGFL